MTQRNVIWWRESVMLHGICVLVFCSWIVGKDYANAVLNEMLRGEDPR